MFNHPICKCGTDGNCSNADCPTYGIISYSENSSLLPSITLPPENSSVLPTVKIPNKNTPTQISSLTEVLPSSSSAERIWNVRTRFPQIRTESYQFQYIFKDGLSGTTDHTRYLFQSTYYQDGSSIYYNDNDNKVTRIDISTGASVWQSDMEGVIIGIGPSTILVYTEDNRIYALDKNNGRRTGKS